MTYRELFELVPEDRMDSEIVIVDSWNGNVWTGAHAEIAEEDVEDRENDDAVLASAGDPVIVLP